jgi:hypothetical protein
VLDILLVGRTPLGSALRAVVIAILLTLFWTFFLNGRWTLLIVSLITAVAVVLAAHLFSRRDNPFRPPPV